MPRSLQLTKVYQGQGAKQGRFKQAARILRRVNNELAARIDLPQPGGLLTSAAITTACAQLSPDIFQTPTLSSDYQAFARDPRRPTFSRAQFE